ncbi:methionyl-tRNA formyltransferase [Halosimplex marinum]|uniref:methionyl-tRNA formyltransferase n=1 Tax=Halosimplex marinum TaxID=3396620 RepID=UPI003F5786F1
MNYDVVLLTMDEPMYMPRYLEPVLDACSDRIEEVVFAPHPEEDLLTTARRRYRMLGPAAFLGFGLRYGVGTALAKLPDRLDRAVGGRSHSVAALCDRHDIPCRTVDDVNDRAFVGEMRERDPDLLLSISAQQRLGEELLSVPADGAVNVHGSLLPKYRGRATAFWVLFNGEDESGVTAHYMTPEYDAGEILAQRRFEITGDDTMDDVYLKIADTGAELAVDVVDRLADGDVTTAPNDPEDGEYYSLPDPEDRREFRRRGNEFY